MVYIDEEYKKAINRVIEMHKEGKTIEQIADYFDACTAEHFGGEYNEKYCEDNKNCDNCMINRIKKIVESANVDDKKVMCGVTGLECSKCSPCCGNKKEGV